MGSARPRPEFLAKKLLLIRRNLGISQQQLLNLLGVQDQIDYTYISKYELNKNEPPLLILLAYARLARVPVDVLIDDEIELDALSNSFGDAPPVFQTVYFALGVLLR